jgi:hypothetical protein
VITTTIIIGTIAGSGRSRAVGRLSEKAAATPPFFIDVKAAHGYKYALIE